METNQLDPEQFEALDLKLGAICGAINRLSDSLSRWLAIIAQAQANPEDAELRAQITNLKASSDALQKAVDTQLQTPTIEGK